MALLLDATDPALTDLDRRALAALKASRQSGGVIVHYDASSLSDADAEAETARARAALEAVQDRLHERLDGPAHLFLYKSAEEFRARTGAPPSWGAFAAGARSLHVPRGAPFRHEISHLFAHRITGSVDRDPGGLLREGLATAMEGEDQGVPVSSWAAVYARLGLLPSLRTLREDWPKGSPKEFHPYHAAGSFLEWLLATEGLVKVKALYADPSRTEEVLGRAWDDVERDWNAWLAELRVPDLDEDTVRLALLLPMDRLPESLAQGPAESLFDGESLEGWNAARTGSWSAGDGVLRGEGGEMWSMLTTTRRWRGAFALRASVRIRGGGGLLLRVNHVEGSSDEALLTPDGCSVTLRGGEGGARRSAVYLVPDRWTDVILAQDGGTARLYLDGRLVVEAAGAFGTPGGGAGIGVSGPGAEVRAVSVIPSLSATREEGGVVVHYDPGTFPGPDAEAEAARARAALEAVQVRLHERLEGPVHVYLYRDAQELRLRTGGADPRGAIAAGTRSLHVPRGAPLRYQAARLLSGRLAGPSGADPGDLLREGIAAAMEGADREIPVSSWAAVYLRVGLLPSLRDLRVPRPDGSPSDLRPYHAAGSFVEWLLATHGLVKLKAIYADPAGAEAILGSGWDDLERDWRAWLAGRRVLDAGEDAVRRTLALPTERLPESLAKGPGEPLFDGSSLEGWTASREGAWTAADGVLRGAGDEGWAILGTRRRWPGAFALRASVRVREGGGVLLRVNHVEGSSDEVLLTHAGSLVTLRGGAAGGMRSAVRLVPGRWTDVVLEQDAGTARLYFDGRLVVEAPGAFGPPGGGAGLGVTGPGAEVRSVSVVLPGK